MRREGGGRASRYTAVPVWREGVKVIELINYLTRYTTTAVPVWREGVKAIELIIKVY